MGQDREKEVFIDYCVPNKVIDYSFHLLPLQGNWNFPHFED